MATAAALGVTEPYCAGIGGGGYFVYYNARTGAVQTLDGRETAPAGMPKDAFIDPETGQPYPLRAAGDVRASVGVPGTLATWERRAAAVGGTRHSVQRAAAGRGRWPPRVRGGRDVPPPDQENADRFAAIAPTAKLYLPGGDAPLVGSIFNATLISPTPTS